jgi:hypothetical protein
MRLKQLQLKILELHQLLGASVCGVQLLYQDSEIMKPLKFLPPVWKAQYVERPSFVRALQCKHVTKRNRCF